MVQLVYIRGLLYLYKGLKAFLDRLEAPPSSLLCQVTMRSPFFSRVHGWWRIYSWTHQNRRGVLGDLPRIRVTARPSTTATQALPHWQWMSEIISRRQFYSSAAGVNIVLVGFILSPHSIPAWSWWNYGAWYSPIHNFLFVHGIWTINMYVLELWSPGVCCTHSRWSSFPV